ncbi:outer membrane lipoprotein [Noviherbaspirillum aerium]|uniref:glycine zipper 2TM domain-containing protein n=1 Tax=Noviherbaspirillum aerium TaxID=2588497 RepID=UPI00124E0F1C|nr:glycine zipper 2TM domain-containing protein [Noviherbaspirillum aerium]
MENIKTPNRIHPLVAGAAISVMLVSLTGVAAITGMIPNSHSTSAIASGNVGNSIGAAAAATSPAALVERAPAPEPVASAPSQTSTRDRLERNEAPPSPQTKAQRTQAHQQSPSVAQAPAVCKSCGQVESIQAIQQPAQASGVGMVAGAVLGGVLGNQIGDGSGRKIATVAGAVGGGYAGNEVEKRTRATTTYQVRVRMENGAVRTFPFTQQPAWSSGDRVRVVNGQLVART